jgi:energy-converting hydrogenase Eha subunit G
MRHTWKKTAAFLLAFTLVTSPLAQAGFKGGMFGGSGIVAYAAERTETISFTGDLDITEKVTSKNPLKESSKHGIIEA